MKIEADCYMPEMLSLDYLKTVLPEGGLNPLGIIATFDGNSSKFNFRDTINIIGILPRTSRYAGSLFKQLVLSTVAYSLFEITEDAMSFVIDGNIITCRGSNSDETSCIGISESKIEKDNYMFYIGTDASKIIGLTTETREGIHTKINSLFYKIIQQTYTDCNECAEVK